VGSNRRESINGKLAHALARLGSDQAEFNFVSIGDLPLYNQDLEGALPRSVMRFKAEIAAADGLLFVTPEHNPPFPLCSRTSVAADSKCRKAAAPLFSWVFSPNCAL